MWEHTKAELDSLCHKSGRVMVERRGGKRWKEFSSHLDFLQSFASLLREVIRPAMANFGSYAEGIGHKHYIETAEELVDGYLLPTSRISLHVLMNVHPAPPHPVTHSITFKTDGSRNIYVYRKNGGAGAEMTGLPTGYRYAVGRYHPGQLTAEIVESHLKDFLIDAIVPRQRKVPTPHPKERPPGQERVLRCVD